jgi:hypothetical protein
MALTFLEIQDEVLDILDASSIEERGRAKRRINDVYLQVVARTTQAIKSTGAVTLTNLVGDYVLTAAPFSLTDFISIQDVIYNQSGTGVNNELVRKTPHEIYAARNQLWSGYIWAYAIEGTNNLMLLPTPTTGDTLTIHYNYRPPLMATDSDTPSILNDEDVDTVIVGAAWRMSRILKPAMSATLEADFKRRLDETQASQNRVSGGNQSLRRGMRRRPPHDPSTDWRGWGWWG